MALNPDRIVSVSVSLSAAIGQAEFGRTLFLNDVNSVVDNAAEHREFDPIHTFSSLSALQSEFRTGNVFQAGGMYFGQTPAPKPLVVGSWFRGGRTAALLAVDGETGMADAIKDITASGAITLTLNGTAIASTDFSGVTDDASVASTLQTALRAVDATLTCTAHADGGVDIVFSNGVTERPSITATGGHADSATLLGIIGQATPEVYERIAAPEGAEDALNRIQARNPDWYFITARALFSSEDEGPDVATWALANNRSCYISSNDAAVLVPGEQSSNLYKANAATQLAWFAFYNANEFAGLAAAAKMSAWNLAALGAGYTLDGKILSGILPTPLTESEQLELEGKNVSYYESVGTHNRLVGGETFGSWADARYWIDWFQSRLQFELIRLLSVLPVVPYTDQGMQIILSKIAEVCEEGVRNGGIAPGVLSSELAGSVRQITGNSQFDGILDAGYLIYSLPVAQVSQSDRDVRRGPPISLWVKGSSAIQEIDINVNFEN